MLDTSYHGLLDTTYHDMLDTPLVYTAYHRKVNTQIPQLPLVDDSAFMYICEDPD